MPRNPATHKQLKSSCDYKKGFSIYHKQQKSGCHVVLRFTIPSQSHRAPPTTSFPRYKRPPRRSYVRTIRREDCLYSTQLDLSASVPHSHSNQRVCHQFALINAENLIVTYVTRPINTQNHTSPTITNMSLLTTPQRPTNLLSRTSTASTSQLHSKSPTQNTPFDLLTPAISSSLYLATSLKTLISSTITFTLLRLTTLFYCSQYTLVFTFTYTSHFAALLLRQAKVLIQRGWKGTERVRQRLFFEFMVFLLGCGNGLFLVMFWPGWILVALGGLAAWVCR